MINLNHISISYFISFTLSASTGISFSAKKKKKSGTDNLTMQFPFQVQNHSKPITADKMPKIQNYSIENPNLRRGGVENGKHLLSH